MNTIEYPWLTAGSEAAAQPFRGPGIPEDRPAARWFAIDRRTWIGGILVFLGYYLGSKLGFLLTFHPHPVSVLWPPNSILLAALVLTPVRTWWFLLLAALPAHCLSQIQSNVPPLMILCYFISNSCEALTGAGFLRWLCCGSVRFDSVRCVSYFCVFGGIVGPFLSSFLDAGFVTLNQWGSGGYWEIWRIRFFSNVLTALTFVPVIISWFTPRNTVRPRGNQWHYLEAALVFGGLVATCVAALYYEPPFAKPVILYGPLPFLLWAALRFGARGSATAILTISCLAIWSAAHGHGPFTAESPEENALAIQLFLIVMAIPFLYLAAVIEERGKAEERFTKAFRCGPDAMWLARAKDGMLLDVNEQWEKIFGHRRAEAIGRTTTDLGMWVSPYDRARMVAQTAHGGPLRDFELTLRNKAGTALRVLLSADVVELAGETCLIIILRDMTDRQRAEEATRDLTHAARLAAVGELTASIAHELNQPLSAIASNAAAGRRFLSHGSPDQEMLQELLRDVGSDARRAGEIIHGLHHLVRKKEGIRRLISLNEIVGEVTRLLHSDFVGRNASVRTDLAPDLPKVEADPIQIQQILLNLLLNSLEAMESTPAPNRSVNISTNVEGEFVRMSVRDHGIGLPQMNPEQIFEHFYSTKPEGMGMGLTIVRSILDGHKGDLKAENTDDGACFSFRLPIAKASDKAETTA